jgi:hypothetical protein
MSIGCRYTAAISMPATFLGAPMGYSRAHAVRAETASAAASASGARQERTSIGHLPFGVDRHRLATGAGRPFGWRHAGGAGSLFRQYQFVLAGDTQDVLLAGVADADRSHAGQQRIAFQHRDRYAAIRSTSAELDAVTRSISSDEFQLDSGSQSLGTGFAGVLSTTDYKPSKYSLMVDFSPSEFSRFRVQYARDRSMQGMAENQWTAQYIMSLGAHGAHAF